MPSSVAGPNGGRLSALAARNGGRFGLAALVAILLLGLGLRLDYAIEGQAPVFDAKAYARIAAHLEAGDGFTAGRRATQPSTNYSPGLPLLVAGIYAVTGGVNGELARIVLALIAALAVPFTYLLGRRLGGVAAGLIGAAAVAVYPALLEYGGMLMSEPLAATLLAAGVLALLWAGDGRRVDGEPGDTGSGTGTWWRWLLAGALLGALSLVRPEYLAVSLLLALLVAARGVWLSFVTHRLTKDNHAPAGLTKDNHAERGGLSWRRSLGAAALVLVGIVVVLAPWTVRNAVALHRFVPVSTGGGQVLFAGTYLPSGGDPEKVGAEVVERHSELFAPRAVQNLRLEQILARLAHHRYPELEADEALSKMGKEQLWNGITEKPLEYAGFVAAKIGRVWAHGPRDVMREELWEALHWALLGFGLLGLAVLLRRRRWEAALIAAVFLAITLVTAVTVASPRRVLVMLPLLAACAGFGVVWLDAQSLRLGPPGQTDPKPAPDS
ncbi:MAG: phospholipid carrier-dependent glycosyltransferase [Actinobacteria bacterium]|nr:phospholipid carrier-dependent glycosyltransferase [Actinomycetota bacterium]